MRRPRKAHYVAGRFAGKAGIQADAQRGRMIIGDDLDLFERMKAFIEKEARGIAAARRKRKRESPTLKRVATAMVRDYTAAALKNAKQKDLMERYRVGTGTARTAREIALSIKLR